MRVHFSSSILSLTYSVSNDFAEAIILLSKIILIETQNLNLFKSLISSKASSRITPIKDEIFIEYFELKLAYRCYSGVNI
jgi:hypothetical protein